MKSKIVLFGEFLLRLTPPAPQKILQASQLQMHWAGSEVIAVSLSTLGDSPLYVRCVPRNDLAKAGLGELKKYNIAANTLWPRTTIDTAAVRNLLGGESLVNMSRRPEIIADSAFYLLQKPSSECTGNSFIDEEILIEEGVTDLEKYAVKPGGKLYTDLFLEDDEPSLRR